MKRKKKIIFLIILTIFTFIIGGINVKAADYNIQDKKTIGYKKYTKTNNTVVKNKAIFFTVDDNPAYCLELGKDFISSSNAGKADVKEKLSDFLGSNSSKKPYYSLDVDITREDYINLVAYLGTELGKTKTGSSNIVNTIIGNDTSDAGTGTNRLKARNYYLAAQKLIWIETNNSIYKKNNIVLYDDYYVRNQKWTSTNAKNLSANIKDIINEVENYFTLPEICDTTQDIKIISTEDSGTYTSGDLGSYSYGGNFSISNTGENISCSISNNKLTCTGYKDKEGTYEVDLVRNNNTNSSSNNVFQKNDGQKVMTGYLPQVTCKVKMEVSSNNTIKIKKTSNETKSKAMSGIKFKVCTVNGDNCTNTCKETLGTSTKGYTYLYNPYSSTDNDKKFTNDDENKKICIYELSNYTGSINTNEISKTTPYKYTITNDNATLNIVNAIVGKITITKKDINGNVLKDAEFTATNIDTQKTYKKITDDNGKITFELPAGKYTLEETEVPINESGNPYIKANDITFTIEAGNNDNKLDNNTSNIIIDEVESANIKVIKTDGETTYPMEGVKFKIYSVEAVDSSDETSSDDKAEEKLTLIKEDIITDEKGEALIENLPYGKYKIVETETLEGYLLNEKDFVIDLTENKTYDLNITNEKVSQTGDVAIMLIITLGICAITIATITYRKKNKLSKNNA